MKYRITKYEPRMYIDERGARNNVRVVHFETDSGFSGRVEIGEQVITEKILDALIQKEIKNALKISREAKK